MKIRKKHIWQVIIFFIVTGLFFAGYVVYLAKFKSKHRYEKALASEPYDAIIVPGFPFHGGKWEDVMRMRVVWSSYLYRKGIAKNVIYSGSAVYSPYVESRIMALYGRKLGIDTAHIFTEEKAEHSTENIYYSYHLAKEQGFKRIAVATDPFQTAMLESFIDREIDGKVDYIPVVFEILKKIDTLNPAIDPGTARVAGFESLENREGFWKRLRGTLGKNIDKENPGQDKSP